VVEAVNGGEEEAIVETSIAGMTERAASMITVRVLVAVFPQVSVAT
jgi:hypothetical protein